MNDETVVLPKEDEADNLLRCLNCGCELGYTGNYKTLLQSLADAGIEVVDGKVVDLIRNRLTNSLEMLYSRYDNGDDAYEDPDNYDGYLGKCIKLSGEEEDEILALIPSLPAAPKGEKP